MSLLKLIYEVHKSADEDKENKQLYKWLVELLYRRDVDEYASVDDIKCEIQKLEFKEDEHSKKLKAFLEELADYCSREGIARFPIQDIDNIDFSKL